MKNVIIFFIALLFPLTSVCQEKDFTISDLHDSEILRTLFDTKEIDTSGAALWYPNFAEAHEFNVSYDSLCHTSLDTIMQYPGYKQTDALMIFTTYGYDESGNREGCHVCAPDLSTAIFSKQKDSLWHFEQMKKHLTRHGAFGAMQGTSLRKIGANEYALQLDGGYMGQGYFTEFIDLYALDINAFEKIHSVFSHDDNSGAAEDSMKEYSWDKKIEFVPGKDTAGCYDIIETKSGKGRQVEDDFDSPLINFLEKHYYRMDVDLRKYVLVK